MKHNKHRCFTLDDIFWYLIYSLPFVLYMLYTRAGGDLTFIEYLTSNDLTVFTDSFIFDTFASIFGSEGVLPMFDQTALYIVSWFVSIFLVHLCVDFLLFLPRMCHHWMSIGQGGAD